MVGQRAELLVELDPTTETVLTSGDIVSTV